MTDSGYVEGIYSLFDESDEIKFKFHSSEQNLLNTISDSWNVKRLQWFTKGFYKVSHVDDKIVMTDLRMGVGQLYFFNFVVGKKNKGKIVIAEVERFESEKFNGSESFKTISSPTIFAAIPSASAHPALSIPCRSGLV